MEKQEKEQQQTNPKYSKKSQKNPNPDLRDVSGLTYQEHMKRRPQPQPNIWIAEKYKENFTMPKPLDGSSME